MTGTQEITFCGHGLSEYGCVILEPPKRPFPKRKYDKKTVYGRSGDLIIDSEAYDNISLSYKVATIPELYGARFADEVLTRLKTWLCRSVDYQKLYDTELPNGFYNAFCSGISDAVCTFDDMYEFSINFSCKPFFYYGSGQKTVVKNERELTLFNYGTIPSQPLIELRGVGSFECTINARQFTVSDVIDGITIDSEKKLVYGGGVSRTHQFKGEYPLLDVGQNSIRIVGGALGSVKITPRWCRL